MSKVNKLSPDAVILKPHLTERAALGEALTKPVYTFVVASRATKPEISRAIKTLYQVTPLKVNILRSKPKRFVYRGRGGKTAGFKKARVFLPAGTKITLL